MSWRERLGRNWGRLGMKFDTIKLSELAEIQTGPFGSQLHKEDYVVNGTPIVTVEHLGNRKFTEQNLPCVSDKDKERLKKYMLKTGDIVFSRVGSVDRCSYVSAEYEGWMFSGRCLRVRPCEILNSEYLYYFFSLKETKQFVRNIATGATMPSINTKFMGEVPIRVPSMEAQNKIASILWMIDDKIELNEKINNNLEQQAKALYKNWFFDFSTFSSDGNLPDGWRLGTVGDIIQLHDSKRVPLSGAERNKMAKVYPYYGAASRMDYVDSYLFDGIYLLLGEDGTVVDSLGFPILQYVYGQFWVNNHAHIITGKEGFSVEELYLLFSLTNIKSIVTGAVQQKVSQQNLKKVPAIIPGKEALDAFDEIIQPVFTQIRNLRDENANLAVLRDTLLPKLMSGELDVSDVDL